VLDFAIAVATSVGHSAVATCIGHSEDHSLCSILVMDRQSYVLAPVKQAEVVKNS